MLITPPIKKVLITTPIAWECQCETRCIHSLDEHQCRHCHNRQTKRPYARIVEIAEERPDLIFAALKQPGWRDIIERDLKLAQVVKPDWIIPAEIAVALQAHKSNPPMFFYPKLEKGKLYLRLLHGRKDKGESLDDWGFDGPIFGPLTGAHNVYTAHLDLDFERDDDARAQGLDGDFPELKWDADTLTFAGCWFGDFTLFVATGEEQL